MFYHNALNYRLSWIYYQDNGSPIIMKSTSNCAFKLLNLQGFVNVCFAYVVLAVLYVGWQATERDV